MDIKFLFQNIQGLAEQAMAQWLIHLSMMGCMYMLLLNLMDVTTKSCVRRRVLSFNSMYVVTHTFYCYLTAPITKFLVSEYFSDDGTGRLASLTVLINKQQISFVSAYANYGHDRVKIVEFRRFLQRLVNYITPRTFVGIDANTRLRKPAGAKICAGGPLGSFAPKFHPRCLSGRSRCNSKRSELLWNFCKLHDLGALTIFSEQKCRYTHVRSRYPKGGQWKRVKFERNWIDCLLFFMFLVLLH